MTEVGFGIMQGGVPVGIWPCSLPQAQSAAQRYIERSTLPVTIVRVGHFDSIPIVRPDSPKISPEAESALKRVLNHADSLGKHGDEPELA